MCIEVIVCNVTVVFLRHSVESLLQWKQEMWLLPISHIAPSKQPAENSNVQTKRFLGGPLQRRPYWLAGNEDALAEYAVLTDDKTDIRPCSD